MRTFLAKAEGRKVTVTGRVEDLDGTVLVEASYVPAATNPSALH